MVAIGAMLAHRLDYISSTKAEMSHGLVEFRTPLRRVVRGFALVDAGAALYHHYFLRDDTLQRMLP